MAVARLINSLAFKRQCRINGRARIMKTKWRRVCIDVSRLLWRRLARGNALEARFGEGVKCGIHQQSSRVKCHGGAALASPTRSAAIIYNL